MLCSVPFHPQRHAALSVAIAAAARGWGVETMFGDNGREYARLLVTKKEGFLYEEESDAQIMR